MVLRVADRIGIVGVVPSAQRRRVGVGVIDDNTQREARDANLGGQRNPELTSRTIRYHSDPAEFPFLSSIAYVEALAISQALGRECVEQIRVALTRGRYRGKL